MKNMQIGYIRVSTNDQNTDMQRQVLERAGCEQVFREKMSVTVANQPPRIEKYSANVVGHHLAQRK
jgi:DNA invertase Pin-like site-specific DNA recombinase